MAMSAETKQRLRQAAPHSVEGRAVNVSLDLVLDLGREAK
jgi:hypothetical protein